MLVRYKRICAAEARCEEIVHEDHIRLTNRYTLRSYLFGKEHGVIQSSRAVTKELDDIVNESAIAAYQEFGQPLNS